MASDPNRQKYIDALRRAAMGPRGVAGPDGNLVPMTSGTITQGKSPSNLQKLHRILPQGGYGVGQTVGPLATMVNPIPSLKRTFTGENANQYLNFGKGGPGWKQRLAMGAEDAFNIAGVGSMVKGAGRAAILSAEQAALDKAATVPVYEYGYHVSSKPNITGVVSSTLNKNRGGAGDALADRAYQWKLSPHSGDPSTYQNLLDQASEDAYTWAARLTENQILDDGTTTYLTRGNPFKSIPDQNLSDLSRFGHNKGSAIQGNLEILDQSSNPAWHLPRLSKSDYNQEYLDSIRRLAESRSRQIAWNNRRLANLQSSRPDLFEM